MRPLKRPQSRSCTTTLPIRKWVSFTVSCGNSSRRSLRIVNCGAPDEFAALGAPRAALASSSACGVAGCVRIANLTLHLRHQVLILRALADVRSHVRTCRNHAQLLGACVLQRGFRELGRYALGLNWRRDFGVIQGD